MNLLVTNTRNAQAYGIIRSLRPHANKIVATMYGPNRFVARLSHAANSRYVDKRYFVPSPVEDWRRGTIQRNNTDREEAYIQEILRICEQEAIDVIFPSWEPKVYIFSKNKDRFKERKIVLPIPDYEVLICAMDKYRVIKTAEKVGFPCPKTLAVDEEGQLEAVERQLEYPVVVKPRFSSGGEGLFLATNCGELLERFRSVKNSHGWPLIQEYIPGSVVKRFANVWIVLDQEYKVKACALSRKIRTVFRDSVSQGTAWESFEDDRLIDTAADLCRGLQLNGFVNFQTKQDPRDGSHKLVEVNPRIGYCFWIPLAQGIDTPLLALNVAKGEDFGAIEPVNGRTVFIAPVQDTWAFMGYMVELFAAKLLRYHPVDSENSPPPLAEMLNSYRESYTASRKIFDPYFSDFFRDPLVSFSWWAAFGVFNLQKKLPRIRSRLRRKRGQEVRYESAHYHS